MRTLLWPLIWGAAFSLAPAAAQSLGVFLTGRLTLPDGMPPADMIPMSLECTGGAPLRTMSDARGEFRFRLEVPSGRTALNRSQRLYSCAVVVRIPGFVVLRKLMGNIDVSLGADVGTLVLKPLGSSAGSLISENSVNAPPAARKELLKARQEAERSKWDAAQARLEKALAIYPAYATAWYELGCLQEQQGNRERASESYRKAVEADPKYLSPRIQLAVLAAAGLQWAEAESRSEQVLRMEPRGLPGVYLVHAIACLNQNKLEAAEKSAREGLAQNGAEQQFPKLLHLLGSILERKGDRPGAVEAFRRYLEQAPQAPDAAKTRERIERLSQ